jgi:hypothetical protein
MTKAKVLVGNNTTNALRKVKLISGGGDRSVSNGSTTGANTQSIALSSPTPNTPASATAPAPTKKRKRAPKQLAWEPEHDATLQRLKNMLKNLPVVQHAHRDDAQELCLFTDASDIGWGILITQVPASDMERNNDMFRKPIQQWHHQPLYSTSIPRYSNKHK